MTSAAVPVQVTLSDGTVAPLVDVPDTRARLVGRSVNFRGRIWNLVTDTVELPDGETVVREVVDHSGAVAIVALDDEDRLLVIRQYRHPVGRDLWEVPAGLLDHPGEDPATAAQRELAEETDLTAEQWGVLTDLFTSPGGSTEGLRIYLARGIHEVPSAERYVRSEEERDLVVGWVPLDDVVAAVLAGDVHNPTIVAGALSAFAARAGGWQAVRPADAPWPTRPGARLADTPVESA